MDESLDSEAERHGRRPKAGAACRQKDRPGGRPLLIRGAGGVKEGGS